MKLRKMRDRIGDLWVKYYPITIQQGVFDEETDETLDVTLTNIKNDITNKANHGYVLGEGEEPKTLKEVDEEKALHGYSEEEETKTLKEVDDNLAQLADDVKETTEKPVAQSLSELNARVETLEALIENAEFSKMQTEIIDVISEIKMKGSPLIYVKDEAPSFAPDQLPQFYIDTAARKLYTARGTSSASDWF